MTSLWVAVLQVLAVDAGVVEIPPALLYRQALNAERAGLPKRASAEQVGDWLKAGSVVLVDLRSKEAFAARHLKGAINLPATELTDEEVAKRVPSKKARIVTYCDDQLLPTRRIALTTLGVPSLRALGYEETWVLENLWARKDPTPLAFEEGATAGPRCDTPAPTVDEVRAIVDRERAKRTDLPKAFARSTWTARRDGCHTIAIESPDPAVPDGAHLFTLNQRGVIVDLRIGNSPQSPLKCPAKELTEAELARTVADARARRSDLPSPFPTSRVQVQKARCTWMYFEYRVPEARGDYLVFLIDPLGELMSVQRSHPY